MRGRSALASCGRGPKDDTDRRPFAHPRSIADPFPTVPQNPIRANAQPDFFPVDPIARTAAAASQMIRVETQLLGDPKGAVQPEAGQVCPNDRNSQEPPHGVHGGRPTPGDPLPTPSRRRPPRFWKSGRFVIAPHPAAREPSARSHGSPSLVPTVSVGMPSLTLRVLGSGPPRDSPAREKWPPREFINT